MIPLVCENDWRRTLSDLPKWCPPLGHALVVAPHPDDETLGAGGLISHLCSLGAEVTVVAATDGEKAYPDMPGLGDLRRWEQSQALDRLGVKENQVHRLRLPDSGVEAHEDDLAVALQAIVTQEMYLVAPWRRDFHPDHEACGRAAEYVSRTMQTPIISYFFWTWHRGVLQDLADIKLAILPLTGEDISAKREALLFHQSQLHRRDGSPILPQHLLESVDRPFDVFLVP